MRKFFGCILIMVLSTSFATAQAIITKQLVDSLANTLVIKKAQDVKILKMDSVHLLHVHKDSVQRSEINHLKRNEVDFRSVAQSQKTIISNQKEDLVIVNKKVKKAGLKGFAFGTGFGIVITVLIIVLL